MAYKIIKQTALTTELADQKFPNITGASFQGDVTFTSTMRAMLAGRLSAKESITADIVTVDNLDELKNITSKLPSENSIRIYNCPADFRRNLAPTMYEKSVKMVDGLIANNEVGYTSEQVFQKMLGNYGFAYINASKKTAVVFVFGLSVALWHCLQPTIIKLLPWHFGKNPGKTYDMTALCESLLANDMVKYCATINKRAEELLVPNACEILDMK